MPDAGQMVRVNAAAILLGISANTLRDWETRYGYPRPVRSSGGHRYYVLEEIEALRQTLAAAHGSAAALALAHQGRSTGTPAERVVSALRSFSEDSADRLLEESLAVRSVERTIEEVLLAAVAVHAETASGTPVFEFAWRYAVGWLSSLKRLSPPATRQEGIVLLDAWRAGSLDTLYAQALEIMLRRAGFRTLSLAPAPDRGRLELAMRTLAPRAVVFTGATASSEDLARIVWFIRRAAPGASIYHFRRGQVPGEPGPMVHLGPGPLGAREELIRRVIPSVSGAATA